MIPALIPVPQTPSVKFRTVSAVRSLVELRSTSSGKYLCRYHPQPTMTSRPVRSAIVLSPSMFLQFFGHPSYRVRVAEQVLVRLSEPKRSATTGSKTVMTSVGPPCNQ